MARMGHDSPRAALIYQHTSTEADKAIAEAVNTAVKAAQRKARSVRGGTRADAGTTRRTERPACFPRLAERADYPLSGRTTR
jgi:hypothetical protein